MKISFLNFKKSTFRPHSDLQDYIWQRKCQARHLVPVGWPNKNQHNQTICFRPKYLQTKRSNLEIRNQFFSNRVVGTWNKLSNNIKDAPHLKLFKSMYDKTLMEILKNINQRTPLNFYLKYPWSRRHRQTKKYIAAACTCSTCTVLEYLLQYLLVDPRLLETYHIGPGSRPELSNAPLKLGLETRSSLQMFSLRWSMKLQT